MEVPNELGMTYYHDQLSSLGKRIYDRMLEQFRRGDFSGRLTLVTSEPLERVQEDCIKACRALVDDRPEIFFLGTECTFVNRFRTWLIIVEILYKPEIIRRIQYQFAKTLHKLTWGTDTLSLLERERLIYERVATQFRYMNNQDEVDHNVVGPVLLKEGVCEGLAALLIAALRKVGITCIKVCGKSRNFPQVPHAWCIAWIGSTPVHCDVTWDVTEERSLCMFAYFNLSDSQLEQDHILAYEYRMPICLSERYSFYSYYRYIVHSYLEVYHRIWSAQRRKEGHVYLDFAYVPRGGTLAETQRAIREVGIEQATLRTVHSKVLVEF